MNLFKTGKVTQERAKKVQKLKLVRKRVRPKKNSELLTNEGKGYGGKRLEEDEGSPKLHKKEKSAVNRTQHTGERERGWRMVLRKRRVDDRCGSSLGN